MHLQESGSGSMRLTAATNGWYYPLGTPVALGKRDTTCGNSFSARSFVENWFQPDPACALSDVAYSITWHVVRKGQ